MKGEQRFSWLILLLPVFPAVDFYKNNRWLCPGNEAVFIITVAALTGMVLYLGARLARRSHEYSVVFAALVGMLLHSNGHLSTAMQSLGMEMETSMSLSVQVLILVLLVAGAHVLARFGAKNANILGALIVTTVILIAYPSALLLSSFEVQIRFERDDPASDTAQMKSSGNRSPNIVVLLLDGYARQDVLLEMYEFDNEPFVAALRERGFFVADSSRSNYNQTLLSMLSMFSMKHLQRSEVVDLVEDDVRIALNRQFSEAHMWRIVKSKGYNVALLTPYFFLDTKDNMVSESEFRAASYSGIRTLYFYGTTWRIIEKIIRICGMDDNKSLPKKQQDFVQQMLKKTIEVTRSASPVFMLTHVPHPHPPFVYGDGENLPWGPFAWSDGNHFTDGNNIDSKAYRRFYKSQLEAMNPIILNTIDELLSIEPPITLFVLSDHGPGSETDWEDCARSNMKERFSTLFAARMSDPGWLPYTNNVTLVNVFQPVLRRYYGYVIQNADNKSFYSTYNEPLTLTDVSDEIDRPWDDKAYSIGDRK